MKKATLYLKSLALPAILVMLVFGACKKDVLSSKELLVFLQGDKTSFTNSKTIPFVHTPVEVIGNTLVEVSAFATREVPAAIELNISPSPELLSSYNESNETALELLPASAYRVVSSAPVQIAAGSRVSSAYQIEITNAAALTNPGGYLLPLSINTIESKDKGVQISTTHRAMYLEITYAFNNIQAGETPLTGTLADRTGWSVSVSNTTNGAPGSNLLDGSNSSVWRSSNSSSAAKWIVLDLAALREVKGFRISPSYNSANENAKSLSIAISDDNLNWTEQGIWNGTGTRSGTNASNPDFKGINFISPVQARYVRFTYLSWVGGNRVGMAEINVVE